ncbi:MAG: NAD(P)-dependent alcohol dehydrogenase [Chitinophagaceae bacterium]|nr:NAD(P)-dependent alcohol dehydrogenase [Chitinophagaceae bacterium]
MLAAIRTKYGGPEVLSVRETITPVPKDRQLLVRVHNTTVNRTDCGVLWGKPFIFRLFTGLPKPRQASTGTDFAGTVEAVGKGVTAFHPGDRVFGFNDNNLGSHAQYLVVPENGPVAIIPPNVSFEDAAASPEGAHYAYNYIRKTKMKADHDVMVYGATGAIGSAAVQLLKHIGAHITAVCNNKNVALIRSLGPDKVIDYETEDFTAGGEQYNFILDAVGKSSFGVCKKLLKPGGLYMSSELGPGNENLYLPLTTRFASRRVVFPVPTDIKLTLAWLKELLDGGHFKPVIDRTYPLKQIADAFTYVNSGQKTGNVLLKIN